MNELPEALNASAWLHGETAFSTLRTRLGQPLLWAEHLERLGDTCALLGFSSPQVYWPDGPGPLEPFAQGRLRLTVGAGGGWRTHTPLPVPAVPPEGVSVWLSRMRVHPDLAGHKTGNYLPYLLARREAQAQGCFEALLRGEGGSVVDGSISGLVVEMNGALLVPQGGLPSITRACWLGEWGRPWHTAQLTPQDLKAASRLWLTGSGLGVVPVARLNTPEGQYSYPVWWPPVAHPALTVPGRNAKTGGP